jgi:hypothetical protein
MEMEEIARWAYIAFLIIAILAGLVIGYMAFSEHDNAPTGGTGFEVEGIAENHGYVLLIMLILGVLIGLAGSITSKEITPFLIATIALMVVGSSSVWSPLLQVNVLQILYYWATAITTYIAGFAAPAAVIISIKGIIAMTKE